MAGNNRSRHHHYNPPAVEVSGDKEVLNSAVETLGLPEETLALLKNNKFNTVYDIAKRTERDMFRIQTFNKKHLVAVKKAINAKGIDFLPFVEKTKPEAVEGAQPAPQKAESAKPERQQNQPQNNNRPPRDNNRPQQPNGQNGAKPQKNNGQRPQQTNNNRQQNGGNGNQPRQQQPKPEVRKPAPEPRRPKVELPLEEWEKVCKNGKWGFSNGLTTVIQPQFDEVFCFRDGLACVDVGEKFGYIDQTGEFVITPQYECAMSFSEGMAVFFEGEKCGYINKQNEVVIPAKYDAATAFSEGRAKVKEAGKWCTIDPEGNVLWSK